MSNIEFMHKLSMDFHSNIDQNHKLLEREICIAKISHKIWPIKLIKIMNFPKRPLNLNF